MINFSAISNKANRTWVGRAIRSPLALLPKDAVVPIVQGPLRGKKWIVGSCIHSCWLGSYEVAEAAHMANMVKPGSVFFDVGAQAGYHTLLASQLVGRHGLVFAFEPVPTNAANIRRHLALNAVRNVVVVEGAVSDVDGTALFDSGVNLMSGHLCGMGTLSVRSLTLDHEIERGALPEPDFIKIDVEGAEAQVLLGAQNLLASRHPRLFIETHQWIPGCESSYRDCCRILEDLHYEHLQDDAKTLNSAYHICAEGLKTETSTPIESAGMSSMSL
jgi:FkbM family methyltransferase